MTQSIQRPRPSAGVLVSGADSGSGNGFKIRLLLAQLRKSYRWVELDILANATRTPEFLAKRQLEDAAGKK